ncbi:MAG TPA: c-type cytochrome biogenesis protein CcmI [Nevskiaceae bacterium]|nr:c-type cytochrome biogenesis protein CcmI [Nevskiaceae bacterium]
MTLALMALVVLLAAAWLTRPLWRATLDERQRRRAANVAAFRQRQAELARDEEAGLFDAATAASLKAELETRLLRDAETPDVAVSGGRRSVLLAGLVTIVIGGAAGVGYFLGDTWPVQLQIAGGAPTPAPGAPGSVEEMVARLAERMEEQPDDPQGWAMLGRSYFVLQRYADAATAYSRANALTGSQEPDLLVNEGEALAMARDRDLVGRPQQLFDAALAIAPAHTKGLWYAGLAAQQAGQSDVARSRWAALSRQELPPEVRALLDERLGALGSAPVASGAAPDAGAATVQADTPPAASAPDAPAIRVAVRVKPELVAQVPSDATLFVFAKAASGPPMPLAVYRGRASELPREVRLDDSMAMTPAMKLSSFDRWTVTARVSRGGQAQAMSGDLQGSLTVGRADLGDSALALVLDQVVP